MPKAAALAIVADVLKVHSLGASLEEPHFIEALARVAIAMLDAPPLSSVYSSKVDRVDAVFRACGLGNIRELSLRLRNPAILKESVPSLQAADFQAAASSREEDKFEERSPSDVPPAVVAPLATSPSTHVGVSSPHMHTAVPPVMIPPSYSGGGYYAYQPMPPSMYPQPMMMSAPHMMGIGMGYNESASQAGMAYTGPPQGSPWMPHPHPMHSMAMPLAPHHSMYGPWGHMGAHPSSHGGAAFSSHSYSQASSHDSPSAPVSSVSNEGIRAPARSPSKLLPLSTPSAVESSNALPHHLTTATHTSGVLVGIAYPRHAAGQQLALFSDPGEAVSTFRTAASFAATVSPVLHGGANN